MEASATQKILAALLSYKLKQEYSEMFVFVRVRMSLEIVRSNILLLHVSRDKGARVGQIPVMTYEVVMVLLAPWWG